MQESGRWGRGRVSLRVVVASAPAHKNSAERAPAQFFDCGVPATTIEWGGAIGRRAVLLTSADEI